jgi:hypothetical protein
MKRTAIALLIFFIPLHGYAAEQDDLLKNCPLTSEDKATVSLESQKEWCKCFAGLKRSSIEKPETKVLFSTDEIMLALCIAKLPKTERPKRFRERDIYLNSK